MASRRPVLLLIRELDYGGTERQFTEIAKALRGSPFEPHVGCFLPEGLCGDELRALKMPIAAFPVRSLASASVLIAARKLAAYVRAHRIELVHTWDVPANIFGVFAARAAGVRVVLSSQRAHRDLTPGVYRHLLRVTDHFVDGIVVNCEAMRQHLIEDERVPAGRIHLCYNSVDGAKFHPRVPRRPAQLADASLIVGAACVLRPEKGLGTLVEAFARVRRPGVKLLLIGNGPSQPALEEQARTLGVTDDVVILPPASDIEEWLSTFDIFVLPSLSEALSNSIMEAMASGCPVVASAVGGNPELVRHGETGLVFPPGDAGALAANLDRLIADAELRRQLAGGGMGFMRERFSLEAAVADIEQIYGGFLE